MTVQPTDYRIAVPAPVLEDLKYRLSRTRWADTMRGSGWKYGADVGQVRELCEYWRTTYNWREHEDRLNQIPQFQARVDGVEIHFFHVRARKPALMPLLLLHGWPGSVYEFAGLIEPLTNPDSDGWEPAFDVVIPSMPGFGFSGKPQEGGWNADRIAAAFHTLMRQVLGYSRFGVQGGDWGTIVGSRLASAYPDTLLGLHINMPFAYPRNPSAEESAKFNALMLAETGYMHLQNTKPDALTIAQADSPAGLAAWILEKFRSWSDCSGDVFSAFSKDDLITNLMFYWAPNSIASAARAYFESAALDPPLFQHARVSVPTGVAAFPKEPYRVPRDWVEPLFNIVSWTDMPRGGHFPALEQPGLLVDDVQRFFANRASDVSA